MHLQDVKHEVQDRLEPARERVSGRLDAGRGRAADAWEAAEPARQRVSEVSNRAADKAREAAEAAAPHVQQAREAARPVAGRVKDAAGETAGIIATPLERFVAVLKALFGDLEEKGRELAYTVDPPKTVTRRSRSRAAGWFAGGFALGAGLGWFAHRRYQQDRIEGAQDPEQHVREVSRDDATEAPYGEDAAAIDARREQVNFN